jgi:hypothetical protein
MEQIKKRNMMVQVLLMIITVGIYGVYWYYETCKELKALTQEEAAAPGLWTVILFIPFGAIYSHFKYAELFAKVSTEKIDKWIIFILWLVFAPVVWFLVQRDLNQFAESRKLIA